MRVNCVGNWKRECEQISSLWSSISSLVDLSHAHADQGEYLTMETSSVMARCGGLARVTTGGGGHVC